MMSSGDESIKLVDVGTEITRASVFDIPRPETKISSPKSSSFPMKAALFSNFYNL